MFTTQNSILLPLSNKSRIINNKLNKKIMTKKPCDKKSKIRSKGKGRGKGTGAGKGPISPKPSWKK